MNQPVYFDYCATTPLHPDVLKAMLQVLEQNFGNPSSMHWAGQAAAEIKENSRAMVAAGLGCSPQEIIFTSGATEADNLAILGILRQYPPPNAHLITCQTEHHAILHAAHQAEKEGYSVTYLPVDISGRIDLDELQKSIRPETRLISIMLVNNETGVIQPIRKISEIAREHRILLHTDAVQGMGLPDSQVNALHIDLLSLSAHKIYGPKGVGALYLRNGIPLQPISYGGPQEFNMRAGTENLPGIVGLAAAVQHIQLTKEVSRKRFLQFRKKLLENLQSDLPKVIINGEPEYTAPHVVSVSFPHVSGEIMLLRLNMLGFAVSLGSACTSRDIVPSHVLKAMGLPPELIEGTLRISFGEQTTEEEIDRFLLVLPDIVRNAIES